MIEESVYQKYLSALLAGRRSECHHMVQRLLDDRIEIEDLYAGLFQRSMYRVGELWETNRITVATEHLATAITEGLLNLVYPSLFETDRIGKTAIVSCAANEFHQIGGKMVADIMELNGWDAHFLGANTPCEDISAHVQQVQPDVVGLSLSILSNMDSLKRCMDVIKADFPGMHILVGGQAFRQGGVDVINQYPGAEYLPSLLALESMIKQK
jgi:MerR family transcriptional regulator, light-induced transcriptional regulator